MARYLQARMRTTEVVCPVSEDMAGDEEACRLFAQQKLMELVPLFMEVTVSDSAIQFEHGIAFEHGEDKA